MTRARNREKICLLYTSNRERNRANERSLPYFSGGIKSGRRGGKNGKIIGMWADYYDYKTDINDYGSKDKEELLTAISSKIETSSNTLKVGGSYKLLSLHIFNHELDITDSYSKYNFSWSCYINDKDFTNQVIWLQQKDFNKIKIKFPNERKYLNKILNIKCSLEFETSKIDTELKLQLII